MKCPSGKVMMTKREAQEHVNSLKKRRGREGKRLYPCPECNAWHTARTDRWRTKWKRG